MTVTRSTTKITNQNSIYYMTRNSNAMNTAYNKLALQQQVVNLSDNPLSANIGIKMTQVISKSEQYVRNINSTGIPAMQYAEKYILNSKGLMDSVKTLTVGAANGPTTPEQRAANAQELNSILSQLISYGNANDGTRYVFGGQNTTTPPFTVVNGRYVNYTGNKEAINLIVDNYSSVAINVTGDQLFGNMTTTVSSKDMNPGVNLTTDHSTKLSDLNGGSGVPKGKVTIKYSAYPDGLEVDLSNCDTLEDVKDAIEHATLEASRKLNTAECSWLDASNLDWRDLQDRYVKVTVNPDGNGISLQEFDLGEPLPDPTPAEAHRGLTYSGGDYSVGGNGSVGALGGGAQAVHKLVDANGNAFANLSVDDYAGNKVAEGLGIKGAAHLPAGDSVLDGFIHGRDLNPKLSGGTLLADLEGYNDSTYTFTNGSKPGNIVIKETSQDVNNVFDNWNLSGLTQNKNTGANGELYTRVVNRGTDSDPEYYVELYTRPVDKATAANLVAAGRYTGEGATVVLEEVNNSGLSGTVGVNLPSGIKTASVDLTVEFGDTLQASVHVPAFIEEQYPNGLPKDVLNIASGWNITGLDKPPASGYDVNHPASTDLDGNVSVNYRYDADDGFFYVELSRPAYENQPAALVATGKIFVGKGLTDTDALTEAVSGRVELVGEEGFEGVGGSVYIELPKGTTFSAANSLTGTQNDPTAVTYQLQSDVASATPGAVVGDIVLGGATELTGGMTVDPGTQLTLSGDTLFKKGQIFDNNVSLPNGGVLPAGTPLAEDTTIRKGQVVEPQNGEILAGTVLAANQAVANVVEIPAGTVIPRGSYFTTAGAEAGFPAGGMGLTSGATSLPVAGYDVQATFATIEDLQRAVREAGIYVDAAINAKGTGIEFTSSLAGAWLTVSEDTDCYEQMGDVNQQLTGLNLNGLVKGANTDPDGNVHTEVVYYPPDPNNPNAKVKLHTASGDIIELDPGYYVRVYSDKSQLDIPYEDRDNSTMVAEGFVASGAWDATFLAQKDTLEAASIAAYEAHLAALDADPAVGPDDPAYLEPWSFNPGMDIFDGADLGFMKDLQLQERNGSGISGVVTLDYHGDRDQTANLTYTTDANGKRQFSFDYSPDDNDDITVYPGGFRAVSTLHTTIQQADIYNPTPGVNCDYSGTVHGVVDKSADGLTTSVTLYRDAGHTVMTGKSDPTQLIGDDGMVTLYDVDRHGNYLDKAGNIIDDPADVARYGVVVGTMSVDAAKLPAGGSDSFELVTGAARNTGQEREENVFSTINDIMDAMNRNDEDALHNLLEDIQRDIDRALAADGDISARQKRLELLVDRHTDDIISFKGIRTSRVGMDEAALIMGTMDFQAAMNAYNAAMQVSSQVMNLSLLNYI